MTMETLEAAKALNSEIQEKEEMIERLQESVDEDIEVCLYIDEDEYALTGEDLGKIIKAVFKPKLAKLKKNFKEL